jgi:alpha-L-fucosidase
VLGAGRLEVDLGQERSFNVVSLVEPVWGWDEYKESRIRSYRFQRWTGATWEDLVAGGSPTGVAIRAIPRVSARRVRLVVEGSRDEPHIADVGIYSEPRQ